MDSIYNEQVLPVCLEQEPLLDEFAISILCFIMLWILEILVRSILSFLKLKTGIQVKDPDNYEPNLTMEELIQCLFGCIIRAFVCCILISHISEFSFMNGWEIGRCANVRVLIALLSYLMVYELLRLPPTGWIIWLRYCIFLLFYISYFSGLPGTVSSYYYGIVFIVTFAESFRWVVQFLLFLRQVCFISKFWKYLILGIQFSISFSLGVLIWFCWVQWQSNFRPYFVKWLMPVCLPFLTGSELWFFFLMMKRFTSRRSNVYGNSSVVSGLKDLSIRKNQQITINPKHFHISSIGGKSSMQPRLSESNISGSTKLFSLDEVLMSNRGSRISKSWNSENQDVTCENRDILPCLYPASEDGSVMSTPIAGNDKIRRHYTGKSTNSTPIKWPHASSKGVSKNKNKLGYTNTTGVNSVNKGRQGGFLTATSATSSSKFDQLSFDQGKRPSYFLVKGTGSNLLPGRLVPIKVMPATPELSTSQFQKTQEKFPLCSQNTSQLARIGSTDYSEDPATLATGDEDFEGMSDDFNFNVLFPFGENAVAPTESNVTNQLGIRSASSPSMLEFSFEVEGYIGKTNSGKGRPKSDVLELVPPNIQGRDRKTPYESDKSRMASDDSVLCAFNTKLPKQPPKAYSAESVIRKRDRNDITVSTLSEFRSSKNKSTSMDYAIGQFSKLNTVHREKTSSSKSLVAMDVQNFDSASEDRSSGWGNVIRIDSSIEFEKKMLHSPIKRSTTLTPTTGSL